MSDPLPGQLPAAQLLAALTALQADERVGAILGPSPLKSLVFSVWGGGFRVELAPSVKVAAAERERAEQAINEALAPLRPAAPAPVPAAPGPRGDPKVHLLAARSALDKGNPGHALDIITEALTRWPTSADLHVYHALALTALGRCPEAVDAYREVTRLQPRNAFAFTGLAQLLAELGRWQEAREAAEAALALDPRDALCLQVLARANLHQGRPREAQEAIERAVEVNPSLPGGKEDLRAVADALAEDVEVTLQEPTPVPTPLPPGAPAPVLKVELAPEPPPPAPPTEPTAAAPEQPSAAPEKPPPEPPPAAPAQANGDAHWGVAAHPAAEGATRACVHCGVRNPEHGSFCLRCGSKLEEDG